jgi:hypothetical protein
MPNVSVSFEGWLLKKRRKKLQGITSSLHPKTHPHSKIIQVSPVAILLFTNQESFHMPLSPVNQPGIRFLSTMLQFPRHPVVKIFTSIPILLHSI